MLKRDKYREQVKECLKENPVTAILGPRQCGKTTLAHMVVKENEGTFFDLENPTHFTRLGNPMYTLQNAEGLIVIDEIQRKPELFEVLRVLVDTAAQKGDIAKKFLVLGSAAPSIVNGVSESLAGRVGFVDLSGFNIFETGADNFQKRWFRGGFPRSFLADNDAASYRWRDNFIRTFLERDIPALGISIPSHTLRRFWTMLAHYHGQTLNIRELSGAIGSAEGTARRYLDILTGAYVVRQLQPFFANVKKRQVKAPKIFIRDSGILHTLLSLTNKQDVLNHPKAGASFEGVIVEEICNLTGGRDVYFWATHGGAELDVLWFKGGKAIGFEIKYRDNPRTTKSMRAAQADLNLAHLYVVYPGNEKFPMDEGITALPAHLLSTEIEKLASR